jgi:hypothetical protein
VLYSEDSEVAVVALLERKGGLMKERMKYEKPVLKKLGLLRLVTKFSF